MVRAGSLLTLVEADKGLSGFEGDGLGNDWGNDESGEADG